jgi:chemotaxis-related protein WspD
MGVRGDRSCPRLREVVHCHHCPVYSAAAAALLNRPVDPAYQGEAATRIAQPKPPIPVATLSAVVFRCGTEWLALPTDTVMEIAPLRTIHSLPHRRNRAVLGLTNVRGELLVCVDLIQLLAPNPPAADGSHSRLLVVQHQGARTAFPVHEVRGVHRFTEADCRTAAAGDRRQGELYAPTILVLGPTAVGRLAPDPLLRAVEVALA